MSPVIKQKKSEIIYSSNGREHVAVLWKERQGEEDVHRLIRHGKVLRIYRLDKIDPRAMNIIDGQDVMPPFFDNADKAIEWMHKNPKMHCQVSIEAVLNIWPNEWIDPEVEEWDI